MARPVTKPAAKPAAPAPAEQPEATPTSDAATAALQAQVAALQAQLAAAQIMATRPAESTAMKYVGIRNVANQTIGLPDSPTPGEGAITLHAQGMDPDPNVVAIISYPFWMQLRKHKYFDNGLIVRDDSILGPTHVPAPADEPRDLAPNHEKNVVLDPYEWIVSKGEHELKEAIARMTSEPSLRRLGWAVQQEVTKFFNALPADDPERIYKAENMLSAKVALAERLIDSRLLELSAAFRDALE